MMSFSQQQSIGFRYVIDALEPSSPYGRAKITGLRFYDAACADELTQELQNVYKTLLCLDRLGPLYSKLERYMMPLKDVRRSVLTCREASLTETELFELKRFCLQSELIAPVFDEVKKESVITGIFIAPQSEALRLLDPENTRAATFYIPDTASRELLSVRREKRSLEEQLRRSTDKAARAALTVQRSAVAALEDAEEQRLREAICESIQPLLSGIIECMDGIAALDFTLARARLARKYGACPVELTDGEIELDGMTNPRICDALRERDRAFTPVSLCAAKGAAVITGANMGGKSVALKTLALNALLVKAGMLPFAKRARLPLFEGIYMVAEDMEDVDRGLSSFGAEIEQFNGMLRSMLDAKNICLALLDEFARGTNPEEGAMIVRAVTRRLNLLPHVSVLTTHYDGVAQFGSAHFEVIGLRDMDIAKVAAEIAVSGKNGADVIAAHMNYGLYRVTDRESCPRDARNICALLGIDETILEDISKEGV